MRACINWITGSAISNKTDSNAKFYHFPVLFIIKVLTNQVFFFLIKNVFFLIWWYVFRKEVFWWQYVLILVDLQHSLLVCLFIQMKIGSVWKMSANYIPKFITFHSSLDYTRGGTLWLLPTVQNHRSYVNMQFKWRLCLLHVLCVCVLWRLV